MKIWQAWSIGVMIAFVAFSAFTYTDKQAMAVCQLSHSFDTCHATLHP